MVAKSKLTEDQVRDIRELLREGEDIALLMEVYGVSYNTIYDIKKGKSWKNVSDKEEV